MQLSKQKYIVREYQADGRDSAESAFNNQVLHEFEICASSLRGAKTAAFKNGLYAAPRELLDTDCNVLAYRFEGKWHDRV